MANYNNKIKKGNQPDISFKYVEPFSLMVGKIVYVIGHAIDLIQKNGRDWYIDTHQYIDDFFTTNIYRWKFENSLPEILKDYIPKDILQIAESSVIQIPSDLFTIELPPMHGMVQILNEPFYRTHKEEYFVVNPEVIKPNHKLINNYDRKKVRGYVTKVGGK